MKKILLSSFILTCFLQVNAQKIEVSYPPELFNENFTGNVLLYLSKDNPKPKDVFVGAEIIPAFRLKVEDLQPNEKVVFDDKAISFPVELSNIERGEYFVQAVFDRNLGGRTIGNSAGNLFSKTEKINLTKEFNKTFSIVCNQMVEDLSFSGNEFYQEIIVNSDLLSDFHKKPISINGAVSLPDEYYEKPEAQYPVVYTVFGFGGDYREPLRGEGITSLGNQPVITVYLDGSCPEGHSVYANSDVNGPWGDALVKEFIPAINKKFRTNGANLVTGHSSGGWTVLWLQINYPNTFAGCWASAPDQVDFRNYQNKNIYETDNMYYDDNGHLTADVTLAGFMPMIKSKDTYQMENVVCRGEQIHSFDAVFGAYDEEGDQIRLVIDPQTGDINKKALQFWKRYDISLLLRENWDKFKNEIDNKILITVGDQDNFYLNKAVYLLDDEMRKLNSNMKFVYFSGDHFTVHFNDDYQKTGHDFLEKCYQNWYNNK